MSRSLRIGLGMVVALTLAELGARAVMASTPETIRWYDAAAQLKVEQMDALGEVDVVFAGTSMAWQAFVPDVFDATTGLRAYNAGLAGGTPEVMERWLLEEVVPRTEPTTVVWGLSSFDVAPEYGAAQREVYDRALATRDGPLASVEQRAASISSLIANRSVLRSAYDTFGGGADRRGADLDDAADVLGDRGERLDFTRARGERRELLVSARLRNFAPAPDDLARIGLVIDELHDRGITVLLVQLPVPGRFETAHPNGDADYRLVQAALDWVAVNHDARYLRLTEDVANADFVDFTHLDREAARSFTERFATEFESDRDDRGRFSGSFARVAPVDRGDCTPETIIDEYGFEMDILRCPDGVTVPAPTTGMVSPGRDVAEVMEATTSRVAELADACRAGADPVPALRGIADDLEELARAEVEPDDLRIAVALLGPAILDHPDCRTTTPPVAATDDVLWATGAVTGALDRLAAQFEAKDDLASVVWQNRDQLATATWIREVVAAGTGVDAVVVGSSMARAAIDPTLLSELTGDTFANAAQRGASIELTALWLREFLPALDRPVVIWAVSYYDLYARCFVDRRAEDYRDNARIRSIAFGGLVGGEDRRTWDHLLGPVGADTYGPTTILDTVGSYWVPGTLGQPVTSEDHDPDGLARSYEVAATTWQTGTPCEERVPILSAAIDELRSTGHEVVLVGLPPLARFAEDQPGGFDGFVADAAAFAAEAGPDVPYLPLMSRLGTTAFVDAVHATPEGRDHFTRALAEELDELADDEG